MKIQNKKRDRHVVATIEFELIISFCNANELRLENAVYISVQFKSKRTGGIVIFHFSY